MTLGETISKRRKQLNLTQAQLAEAVGVSNPAVSKWESNTTTPDITLLSPIARKLATDLNTLLNFSPQLSPIETDQLMHTIIEVFNHDGFTAGCQEALRYVQQYPNNNYLKLKVAITINQYSHLLPIDCSVDTLENYRAQIIDLLLDVHHNPRADDHPNLANMALRSLTTLYFENNQFELVESLLYPLPSRKMSGREKLKSVYIELGDLYQAKYLAQSELLIDLESTLLDIQVLFEASLNESNMKMAASYAEDYYTMASLIKLPAYLPSELKVKFAIADNHSLQASEAFDQMIQELINTTSLFTSSKYFDVIKDSLPLMSKLYKQDHRIVMQTSIEANPLYAQILKTESGQASMKKLKRHQSL